MEKRIPISFSCGTWYKAPKGEKVVTPVISHEAAREIAMVQQSVAYEIVISSKDPDYEYAAAVCAECCYSGKKTHSHRFFFIEKPSQPKLISFPFLSAILEKLLRCRQTLKQSTNQLARKVLFIWFETEA